MIRQLADPANAITTFGLALSIAAINLALFDQIELAVSTALWALLADHLDGVVANRTRNRAVITSQVGKNLDSLADLVSAGVFPGIVLAKVTNGAPWGIGVATLLGLASALRLSYFNSVGLDGRNFIGLPTTYALPVVAAVVLLSPFVAPSAVGPTLAVAMLTVAALHVSSLRVPRTRGGMYVIVIIYCVSASVLLALTSFT